MKIIKQGDSDYIKWWVGIGLQCDCGCLFVLEKDDEQLSSFIGETKDSVSANCPNCRTVCCFKK